MLFPGLGENVRSVHGNTIRSPDIPVYLLVCVQERETMPRVSPTSPGALFELTRSHYTSDQVLANGSHSFIEEE